MKQAEIDAEVARAAFARVGLGAFIVDPRGHVIAVNEAATKLFACSLEELIGHPIPGVPPTLLESMGRGEHVFIEIDTVVGAHKVAIAIDATPDVRAGAHLFLMRDVTERRRREVLNDRYQLLARYTSDIVLFLELDGRIVEANDAALKAYGYTLDDMRALSISDLREPMTRREVAPLLEKARESSLFFETVHARKDGTSFPVEVTSRGVNVAGRRLLLSVIRDVTTQRQIQAGLVQADRLATVGTMSAGIAHEINNPLAYALTNVDVLARRIGGLAARVRRSTETGSPIDGAEIATLLEQSVEMIGIAQEGMNRVRSIVRDLKMFSRQDESLKELVDVRAVLDSSANIARGEIRQRAAVVRDYGEVPLVSGSSSRLGQVFLNLIVNAAQAIAEGRTDGEIRLVTQTGPGGEAIVDIVDNGSGIEGPALELVFQPFVTTKKRGEGTGLGLHIARTIVRAAGGDVRVTSTPGIGTTMRVILPPAPVTKMADPRPKGREAVNGDGANILIIDDEEAIGITLRALLSPPHKVTVTTNATDALELALRGDAFDVVFCDVMMPGISGIRFYELVQAKRPDLVSRIVFMTGGMHSPHVQQFMQATNARCLEKPFTDVELEDAIARIRAEHPSVS